MVAPDEHDDASFSLDLSGYDDADANYTERDPDAVDHVERDAEPDPHPKVVCAESPPPASHRHEWFGDLTAATGEPPDHSCLAVGGDSEHGPCLLYDRKVNTVFGPPGSGKSWLAALGAVEVTEWGSAVVIDYEDDAASWSSRLRALLALDPRANEYERWIEVGLAGVRYVRPSGPLTTDPYTLERLLRHIGDTEAGGLVVLDSVGRAMSTDGLSESNPQHVMAWMNALPVALTRLGWAVLLIDHQGKNVGDSPTESFRKVAEVAAAYRLAPRQQFTRTRAGYADLVVKKDRYGTYSEGETVAEFIVQPLEEADTDGATDFKLAPPGAWRRSHSKGAGASRHATPGELPEDVLAATYEALVAAGDAMTKNDWKAAVRGHDRPSVNAAMIALLDGADVDRRVSYREVRRGRTRAHMCWPTAFPDRAPEGAG